MKFKEIGRIIAGILILITLIHFLFVWFKYCDNFQDKDYDVALCIENLVFLIIPPEVIRVQTLESFPTLLLIVLLFYWKFVASHMN